jgi:hypothetical protein
MVPQEVFCAEETGALVTHDKIQHLFLESTVDFLEQLFQDVILSNGRLPLRL